MVQKHLVDKVLGRGDWAFAENLPNNIILKTLSRGTFKLSRALDIHCGGQTQGDKLKGREAELIEDVINAASNVDGVYKEVRESPRTLSSPGNTTVPCLLLQVQGLGIGAAAAEQKCIIIWWNLIINLNKTRGKLCRSL